MDHHPRANDVERSDARRCRKTRPLARRKGVRGSSTHRTLGRDVCIIGLFLRGCLRRLRIREYGPVNDAHDRAARHQNYKLKNPRPVRISRDSKRGENNVRTEHPPHNLIHGELTVKRTLVKVTSMRRHHGSAAYQLAA